jgi:D-alanyl-D-alanine-carboxypeptidase/D-alanyl-D-alanine-endopeptidase
LTPIQNPIEKYLPYRVKVPQFNGKKITLADLATHFSGLPEWLSNIWLYNNVVGNLNSNYTVSQLYQALSNFKLTMAPGSQFQYPSFGMGLLAHMLSLKSSGISYERR